MRNRLRRRFAALFRRDDDALPTDDADRIDEVMPQGVKRLDPFYAAARPNERGLLVAGDTRVLSAWLAVRRG